MDRVTYSELRGIAKRINRLLGKPETPYTRLDDGTFKANIGCYYIYGLCLVIMDNDGGGIRDVLYANNKRELRNNMFSFIGGIYAAKEEGAGL